MKPGTSGGVDAASAAGGKAAGCAAIYGGGPRWLAPACRAGAMRPRPQGRRIVLPA